MYVEGRVVTSSGDPIPDAVIETWETDEKGEQYLIRSSSSAYLLSYVSTPIPTHPPQASTILSIRTAPFQTAVVG
jgi:hypothetical protein